MPNLGIKHGLNIMPDSPTSEWDNYLDHNNAGVPQINIEEKTDLVDDSEKAQPNSAIQHSIRKQKMQNEAKIIQPFKL